MVSTFPPIQPKSQRANRRALVHNAARAAAVVVAGRLQRGLQAAPGAATGPQSQGTHRLARTLHAAQ